MPGRPRVLLVLSHLVWSRERWPAGSSEIHHRATSAGVFLTLLWQSCSLKEQTWVDLRKRGETSLILLVLFFLSLLTVGPLTISFRVLPSERMIMKRNPFVQPGGHYRPPHCFARYKSAILVAYRNQEKQLHHLLYYIHPFLQRQQLSYTIYLIQQVKLSHICLLGSSATPLKGWVLNKKRDSSDVEILVYAWAERRSDMLSHLRDC